MDYAIRVEMLAYGRPNEVRVVTFQLEQEVPVAELLEAVWHWGQNDFQRQPHPSVSIGDVAEVDGQRYIAAIVGWRPLTPEAYVAYKALDRLDRPLVAHDMAALSTASTQSRCHNDVR